MHLGDLREAIEPAVFSFDVDGRRYTVAPVSAHDWLRLQAVQEAADARDFKSDAARMSRIEFGRIVLGPVHDELIEAGVNSQELAHVIRAVHFWQLGANELAETLWNAGKASAPTEGPEVEESTSTTPTGSTSSASASETKPPACSTATTSRPKSKRASTRTKAAATV